MNPTTDSSAPGLTFERETLDQQRDYGNHAFFAGTTAYTQYSAEETIRPEPQRAPADIVSTNRSNREEHKLLGVGSQHFQTGTAQYESRTASVDETYACPYHGPILQERLMNSRSGQGLGPMDRYLAEGPSERYAIFDRPDAGNLSTYKGCRCLERMQSSIDTNDYAQK